MDVIGYIRVSSNKQTCEHQKREIRRFAKENRIMVTKWVTETISSRMPLAKRLLGKVLLELNPGDILVSCEISRLGRSLLEVMRILENCLSKNCQVWTIKENYRLGNDIQSKVLAFAFGLMAEIERNLISQRTKSSMNTLRATGRKLGRPVSSASEALKLRPRMLQIRCMAAEGASYYVIAKQFNVHPETMKRFIKRMRMKKPAIAGVLKKK